MKPAAFALVAALASGPVHAAEPAPVKDAARAPRLSVDTPISILLADPRTGPVLDRGLPQFAERYRKDEEFARFFDGTTPRDLTIDPHVRGFTEDMLMKLQADLEAAQKSS